MTQPKDLEMRIETRQDVEHSSVGDFCAEVNDGKLFIPADIVQLLEEINVRTAQGLMAYAHSFPTYFTKTLGWTPEQLNQAKNRLAAGLFGHVDIEYLFPPKPTLTPKGALLPYRKGIRIN